MENETLETEKLTIKPDISNAIVLNVLFVVVLIVGIRACLWYMGILAGFDVIDLLITTIRDSLKIMGSSTMFSLIINVIEKLLKDIIFQVVALFILFQVPVINLRWKLYNDKLVYQTGYIFVKEHPVPYSDVLNVSCRRYVNHLDFGEMEIRVVGQRIVKLPFVSKIKENTSKLEFVIRNFRKEN